MSDSLPRRSSTTEIRVVGWKDIRDRIMKARAERERKKRERRAS